MRKSVIALSIVGAVFTTAAQAQPAPAPVPDQMPFDVPYGESINLAKAEKAIQAAIAEASKSPRNWKLSIAVVDPSGELVALHKMDQTQVASVGISVGKARTAARYRRPTEIFLQRNATADRRLLRDAGRSTSGRLARRHPSGRRRQDHRGDRVQRSDRGAGRGRLQGRRRDDQVRALLELPSPRSCGEGERRGQSRP